MSVFRFGFSVQPNKTESHFDRKISSNRLVYIGQVNGPWAALAVLAFALWDGWV